MSTTPTKTVKVKLETLKVTVNKALEALGHSEEDAKIIANSILYAELRGNSQGLEKFLKPEFIKKDANAGEISIKQKAPNSILINGARNNGMVVLNHAVNQALEILTSTDQQVVFVGTNTTSTSTGAIGYFVNRIAEHGFIAFIASGTPAFVAPYGSSQKLLGTTPLAVAVPIQDGSMVFDMTTSSISVFGALKLAAEGKPLPGYIAYDAEGNPTSDPQKALTGGAFFSFDSSPKGAGIALMLEILTGLFVSAESNSPETKKENWGNLLIAFRSDMFVSKEQFSSHITNFISGLHELRPTNSSAKVLYPGERGNTAMQLALHAGELTVPLRIWNAIEELAGNRSNL